MVDSSKPLTEQFPVSCGTKHHEKEHDETAVSTVPNVDGSAIMAPPPPLIPQPVFQQPQEVLVNITKLPPILSYSVNG